MILAEQSRMPTSHVWDSTNKAPSGTQKFSNTTQCLNRIGQMFHDIKCGDIIVIRLAIECFNGHIINGMSTSAGLLQCPPRELNALDRIPSFFRNIEENTCIAANVKQGSSLRSMLFLKTQKVFEGLTPFRLGLQIKI